MHGGAISKLLYGCVSVGTIVHSLKVPNYLLEQGHKTYNNLCLYHDLTMFSLQMDDFPIPALKTEPRN